MSAPPVNSSQTARQNAAKQGAAALAAQQAQQAAQRALAAANDRAIQNGRISSGFGNGRITFDSKGNVLVDGKLATTSTGQPIFTTQRAQDQYLAERGLANTGQLVNADLAAKSDFSEAPGLEPRGNPDYENARIKARNESPELVFSNGQIKQNNPNRLNDTLNFGENKPVSGTSDISFTPKGAGSNISADSIFSAKQSTSKNNNSEAEVVFGSGKNTSGVKNSFFIDKSYGQGGSQLVRGSSQESSELLSEASRAAQKANLENNENIDYFTPAEGGTNASIVKNSPPPGGIATKKSNELLGTNFGQSGQGENIRNTQSESDKQSSEASRAFVNNFKILNNENSDYYTPAEGGTNISFVGVNQKPPGGIKTPQSIFLESKTNYGQVAKGQNVRNSSAESLLLVSEANRALAKEQTENVSFTSFNQSSKPNPEAQPSRPKTESNPFSSIGTTGDVFPARELSFNEYLTTNANKGATIDILEGGKVVGSFQGTKAISGVQSYEKAHPDGTFSISAYFPEREKALTEAVQSNPSPFLNQPQGFWTQAAKNGYLSQNNAQKIQNTLFLESAIENRESLAGLRGSTSQFLYQSSGNGEVSSFLKFPFSGKKTSTKEIPSTSLANLAIFAPTFGSGAIEGASVGLESLLGKAGIDLSKTGPTIGESLAGARNKINTSLQNRILLDSPFIDQPKLKESPTFRSTNPTRTQLPSDIFASDNIQPVKPVSARLNPPKNTLLEDITGEQQAKSTKIQNDLLNSAPKVNNPPASTNLPFFAGRINAQGKQLTGNKAPISLINPQSNEAVSVSGKTASIAPISTFTAENSGLSPISRESFAPQFTGTYPQNYLPIATRETFSESNPIQEDPFYNPASKAYNIDIGNGELPEGSFSASNDLIGFKKNRLSENQSIFLRNTQFGLTKPVSKSNAIRIFESKSPEETNPLGRRGKSAIQRNTSQSNPIDFTQTPRSEFVETGTIKPNQEVFSSKGAKLRNEFGDVFFSDLGRPQGALGRSEVKTTSTKPEVNLPERKNYQDWRFSNYLKNTPLTFGIKLGETKIINLEPRGDYQDWRFNEFIKKNPEKGPQEPIGSRSFDLDLKKLPKQYSKAATFSTTNREIKGLSFKSTSSKLVEKPKETKNDVFFKSNTSSSKSETVLVKKPLQKKSLISDTSLANDYDYSFARTPPSRETNLISTTQKGGVLSGLKFASILSPKQSSKSSLDIFSKNGLGLKDFNIFSGKLGQDLFPKQNTRQTPKQVPDILQTPRQGQKPKQGQKQKMNPPQIPRTNQTTSPSFKFFTPEVPIFAPPPPPPRVPLIKPNFSNWNVKGGSKGKSGPTALENLGVRNIFTSSFDIKVEKGKRFEF